MSKETLKKEAVWVAGGHTASWGSTKTSSTFAASPCFPGWSYYSSFLSPLPYWNRKTNAGHQRARQYFLETAFLFCASNHGWGGGAREGLQVGRVNPHLVRSGWASLPWDPGAWLTCVLRSCPAALHFNGKCHLQVPQLAKGSHKSPCLLWWLSTDSVTRPLPARGSMWGDQIRGLGALISSCSTYPWTALRS